jgi:dodecin
LSVARTGAAHPQLRQRILPRTWLDLADVVGLSDRLAKRLRNAAPPDRRGGRRMSDSVYRVTDVIGTSSESWEAAARNAVATAAGTVRDLRIAEVVRQDVTIENGAVTGYRVRLSLSFKYETNE